MGENNIIITKLAQWKILFVNKRNEMVTCSFIICTLYFVNPINALVREVPLQDQHTKDTC